MRSFVVILLLLVLFSLKIFGQKKINNPNDSIINQSFLRKDLTIISGYQIHEHHFAEIGIGVKKDGIVGHHPSTIIYGISNEIKINKGFIWGLKSGLWIGNGYNMGLNLINYTDFNESALFFRPEIGLGFGVFRIIYGYNFKISKIEFAGVNTHNFGLNIMFDIKKLKEHE